MVFFPIAQSSLMLSSSHSLNDWQWILNSSWAKILTFSAFILYEMLTKNLPIEFWLFHCRFLKGHWPILLAAIIAKCLYYGVTVNKRDILKDLHGIRIHHHKISKLYKFFWYYSSLHFSFIEMKVIWSYKYQILDLKNVCFTNPFKYSN